MNAPTTLTSLLYDLGVLAVICLIVWRSTRD